MALTHRIIVLGVLCDLRTLFCQLEATLLDRRFLGSVETRTGACRLGRSH